MTSRPTPADDPYEGINPTVISWLEDPYHEHVAMGMINEAQRRYRLMMNMATPDAAFEIATTGTLHPTISPHLATAAYMAGIPSEDERMAQAVAVEEAQTGQVGGFGGFVANIGDAIRGAVRWTALAATGLYDEVITRPLRTFANMTSNNMSLGEAYANSGDTPFGAFGESIVRGLRGEEVNLGSGWLANSTLSTPVQQALAQIEADSLLVGRGSQAERDEVYKRYADQYGFVGLDFLSPAQQEMVFRSQMRELIMARASDPNEETLGRTQASFGTPVTQRASTEAEGVLWNASGGLAGGPGGSPNYTQVSIGRVFAGLITEGGTAPFHYLSGGLDFLANIFMDPTNLIGVGIAKAAKAGRAIGAGDEVAPILRAVGAANDEVADLGSQINKVVADPNYRRYQSWQPQTRARADEMAHAGITQDMVDAGLASPTNFKYQQAGRAGTEYNRLQARLGELAASDDLTRYQAYTARTQARLQQLGTLHPSRQRQLTANNKGLATQLRIQQNAQAALDEMNTISTRVTALGTDPDYAKFMSWAPRTRERALKLASQADIDPSVNARAAAQQKTARAAHAVARQRFELGVQAREVQKTANPLHQVRRISGILDGVRPDVDPKQVSQFITGRTATRWIDAFVDADLAGVDELLSNVRTTIPPELRIALTDASSRAEVIAALLSHMDEGAPILGKTISTTGMPSRLGQALSSPITQLHKAVNSRVSLQTLNRYSRKPLFSGSRVQRMFAERSPGSMDLNDMGSAYDALVHHALNVGWTRGDESLEKILRSFLEVGDGDFNRAFAVLDDYRTQAVARLSANGLTEDVAKAVTRFIGVDGQQALYWLDDAGRIIDNHHFIFEGRAVPMSGRPHMYTELFKGVIHMPPATQVRHAAAELDVIGRVLNRVVTKGVATDFTQRALVRWTNTAMTRIWKPLVLARLAWPLRVIGEEQFRMGAAGMSQPFTHPIHTIARLIGSPGRVVNEAGELIGARRFLDVLGDDITQSAAFQRSMARRVAFQGDAQPIGLGVWQQLDRQIVPHSHYRDGILSELNQLWSDPVARRLFRQGPDGGIDATVDWLMTTPQGKYILDNLLTKTDDLTRRAFGDADVVRQYAESVYARAHQKAGGSWELHLPDGTIHNSAGDAIRNMPPGTVPPTRPTYVITEAGLDELVESFGTGLWRDIKVANEFAADPKVLALDRNLTDIKAVRRQLDGLIRSTEGAKLPRFVKGARRADPMMESRWDDAVTQLFDLLMSKPTNRLSRSPVFREYYWGHMGEMAPLMDEDVLAAARAGADKAGYLRQFEAAAAPGRTAVQQMRGTRKVTTDVGLITKLDQADEGAKAMALTRVQDLLFDVSKRKNISEALNIIMPFADAWGEVIGTWAKITRQENIRPWRRLQQIIQGGQTSDPFDTTSGYSNEGFFYEKDGREVFAIPFANPVFNALSGSEHNWEYSLGGLSIATDVLPALGPVAQFVAQPIIPDEPGWDWLRGYAEPFGQNSPLGMAVPASWQRLLASFDFTRNLVNDPKLTRLYNNAVMDAQAHMARTDPDFAAKMRANPEAVTAEARNMASQLFWVQALARFIGPAAPSTTPTFEDPTGKIWEISVLADEYYKLLEENGNDTVAATEAFIGRFGIEPFSVVQSKTTEIVPRSEIAIGSNFQRSNPELFEKYPAIAFYLGPAYLEDYADFDSAAYYRQLAEGSREPLTPEEHRQMMMDTKGRLAYDFYKRSIEEHYGKKLSDPGWDTALKEELTDQLNVYDRQLMAEYPGYAGRAFASDVPGVPSKVSVTAQITQLEQAVLDNPQMLEADEEDTPINGALLATAQYLGFRQKAIDTSNAMGVGEVMTAGAENPKDHNYQLRQMLRNAAAQLIASYPEFGPIWEDVFGREMVDDAEQEMTVEDALEMIYGATP